MWPHLSPSLFNVLCTRTCVKELAFFFYLGDLWEKRDGGLLLQGIQSKWCEKTMRGILTCFFVSISFVSLHYGIHHHWLGPSLLIPIEILPPVIPCYFITSTGGERYRGKCYTSDKWIFVLLGITYYICTCRCTHMNHIVHVMQLIWEILWFFTSTTFKYFASAFSQSTQRKKWHFRSMLVSHFDRYIVLKNMR